MLVEADAHDDGHDQHGQRRGDDDVAGDGEEIRDHAEQVRHQDEQEQRRDERQCLQLLAPLLLLLLSAATASEPSLKAARQLLAAGQPAQAATLLQQLFEKAPVAEVAEDPLARRARPALEQEHVAAPVDGPVVGQLGPGHLDQRGIEVDADDGLAGLCARLDHAGPANRAGDEIGRASCRERV